MKHLRQYQNDAINNLAFKAQLAGTYSKLK